MIFNRRANSLDVELVSGKNNIRLKERLYGFDRASGVHICVEPGFRTDLASIPAFARIFISNDSAEIRLASIVHDWIYRHKGRMPGFSYAEREILTIGATRISRAVADSIFYRGLLSQRTNKLKALLMYLAVRAIGWRYWK